MKKTPIRRKKGGYRTNAGFVKLLICSALTPICVFGIFGCFDSKKVPKVPEAPHDTYLMRKMHGDTTRTAYAAGRFYNAEGDQIPTEAVEVLVRSQYAAINHKDSLLLARYFSYPEPK